MGTVDDRILYRAVGRWAGGDEQFSDEVDEQRWQDVLFSFFGGGLLFGTKRGIKGLD